MGVVLACHKAYVGRETLLSWLVVLVAYAGKEGKKNREVSQGGNGLNSNTSVRPVPSCEWRTFTRHRLGLCLIVQVNCYTCARTN